MKIQFDRKFFKISFYAFFTLAALVLFYKVIDNFSNAFDSFRIIIDFIFGLLRPFIIAAVIAYFIYRPVRWIENNLFKFSFIKRRKLRRIISILIIYLIIFIILGTFLYFAIPRIATNIKDLITGIPDYVEKTSEFFTDLNINRRIQNFLKELPIDTSSMDEYNLFAEMDQYVDKILNNAQSTIEGVLNYLLNSAIIFTSGILNVILAIFIAFYILKDKEELFRSINNFGYSFFPTKGVKRGKEILHLADEIFGEYLVAKAIDSAIIGGMCFVGLALLNIKYAFLISIIVGITNMIPYFGPIIGAVPGVILTLFDSPINALWVAILILILQQFDANILTPKIVGDKVGLNPFWVMFAIVIGGGLFGVMGMFLGVPTLAVIRVILLQAMEKRKDSKV